MATFDPLVIDSGVTQKIQDTDKLVNVVYSASSLTPDNALVRIDGTNKDVQASTASVTDEGILIVAQASSLETSGSHGVSFQVRDSTDAEVFSTRAFTAVSGNLAIGRNCLPVVTTGTYNFCFGISAGASIADGSNNLLIGRDAGKLIVDGDNNFCIGKSAGDSIVGGDRNILIGESAGTAIVSALDNIGIGNAALAAATGSSNIGIGRNSGRTIVGGSTNTFIGHTSGYHASQLATATNSTGIGNGVYTTKSDQVVIGDSNVIETVLRGNVLSGDGSYNTLKRASKTAAYTIVDETLVLADATSAAFTVTLPLAADWVDTPFHIKKIDSSANAVTVDGNGSETIDGVTTKALSAQYDVITVVSDGTEWWTL